MSSRADAFAPLLAVVSMAAGTYGYDELKISMLQERYLAAIDVCAIAPATGAGRVARLDRTYTEWWRDRLPDEVRAKANSCVLAAPHQFEVIGDK